MDKRKKSVKYQKIMDEVITLPVKQGNGILRYSLSVNNKGKIGRYSVAYINLNLCSVDNGRVLGFDNCHGYHHRHYMGTEENIHFISYEEIVERFEREWGALHEKVKKQYKS
jgi:hypothetical protein